MPRKKKIAATSVPCPLKGHKHLLLLQPHPDRPDLVVAYCGPRIVFQTATGSEYDVSPDSLSSDPVYVVPAF